MASSRYPEGCTEEDIKNAVDALNTLLEVYGIQNRNPASVHSQKSSPQIQIGYTHIGWAAANTVANGIPKISSNAIYAKDLIYPRAIIYFADPESKFGGHSDSLKETPLYKKLLSMGITLEEDRYASTSPKVATAILEIKDSEKIKKIPELCKKEIEKAYPKESTKEPIPPPVEIAKNQSTLFAHGQDPFALRDIQPKLDESGNKISTARFYFSKETLVKNFLNDVTKKIKNPELDHKGYKNKEAPAHITTLRKILKDYQPTENNLKKLTEKYIEVRNTLNDTNVVVENPNRDQTITKLYKELKDNLSDIDTQLQAAQFTAEFNNPTKPKV